MAKHAFFPLTFLAIVAFSAVSAYRSSTVITTIIEDNNIKSIFNGLEMSSNGHLVDGMGMSSNGGFVEGLEMSSNGRFIDGMGISSNGRFVEGLEMSSNGRFVERLGNPTSSQQCQSQIPIGKLNQCKMHLTQGIIFDKPFDGLDNTFPPHFDGLDNTYPIIFDKLAVRPFQHHQGQHLQQCCSQLKKVSEQCQCAAIQQAFNKAWQQEGGLEKVSEIASKAYKLPNDCGLEVQDCPLKVPRI